MRIRMPDVTNALDAALAETDASKRDARYQDVCKATNANLPWGTMWVANRYGVASAKLKTSSGLRLPPAALTRPTLKVVDRRIGQLPLGGRPFNGRPVPVWNHARKEH
ncbi:hypothetical protein [Agrobacterium sp. FDAARGOS_525]|uniref:hypothetical protein n=1 Tax=Agrobacterium sp. FDAARGOS_525 TaxID=2420311 RepID=UPI00256EC50C|nr:hypothetical protein [Agrobacterium sp. FDAARGOS_525]